jgi:hypothetical protein
VRGAHTQALLDVVVELADGDAGHGRSPENAIIDCTVTF